MRLYEYQAKARLAAAGVPVLPGRLCETPEAATAAAAALGGPVVVKAQVLAGGRGKAGGIRMAADPTEAAAHADELLGRPLLGLTVGRVWLEPRAEVLRELYLGYVLDADACQVLFLLGPGGVDVESHPEAVWRAPVDRTMGLPAFVVRDALLALGLPQDLARPLHEVAVALLALFWETSATLVEINPLADTPTGLVALDARLVVDEGAIEQAPGLAELVREGAEEFADEWVKLTLGFDYVEIDPEGDIGLLTTGAGLTMTVIDLITHLGGRPINFADVRTGSMGRDPTRLTWMLDRLTRRPTLRAVLVNVFAGITNLEEFAHALLTALAGYPALRQSVVVRATGTGFDGARALWEVAGIRVTEDLDEAIELVLQARRRAETPHTPTLLSEPPGG